MSKSKKKDSKKSEKGFRALAENLGKVNAPIRSIKSAAALRDITASLLLEEAAKAWLDRHQDGKK